MIPCFAHVAKTLHTMMAGARIATLHAMAVEIFYAAEDDGCVVDSIDADPE